MNVGEVESTILELIREHVGAHSKRLSELGLAYEISISRNSSASSGYNSEALVEFKDENGPWDMLEFEVARQGRLVASVDDVRKWLPEVFASVVSRREAEMGNTGHTAVQ